MAKKAELYERILIELEYTLQVIDIESYIYVLKDDIKKCHVRKKDKR